VNRQTKRMLQRQGALGPDGTPIAGASTDRVRRQPGAAQRGAAAGAPERGSLPERSIEYLREVRIELQKVAWPGRTEVANYTVVVFVTVVLLTALVFGLDFAFAKGIIYLFRK
jgi:preprotein translocase subunit SecE